MRAAIIGYNTLDEAKAKGLIWEDPDSLNIWFNPGAALERSLVFIPFGRENRDEMLTDRIRYVEWSFPRAPRITLAPRAALHLWRATTYMRSAIADERIDVVKCNGPHIPAAIGWLLRRRRVNIPIGVFIEAFWEQILPAQDYMPAPIKAILPAWYRLVYRSFDAYCGTPTLDPDFYIGKGMDAGRIAQWSNELDLRCLLRGNVTSPIDLSDAGAPRLSAVGRLHAEKKQDHLLHVLAVVRRHFPSASLVLVGDGPLRPQLEQTAAEMGLSDHVKFAGNVSQRAAMHLVRQCDIHLAPLQGNALIEAMACAKPIVAYDNTTHRNLLTHEATGMLSPDDDAQAMAATVLRLLSDREFAARLARNARDYAMAYYAPERVAGHLKDVLDLAVTSHRA